jgi:anti-sigma-K factor RskA
VSTPACEEIDQMLAAAALAGVDEDQKRALDDHLAGCDDCRASAARHMAVAAVLPLAVEEVEPDAALRRRIMATVNAEADRRGASRGRSGLGRLFRWVPSGRAYTGAGLVALAGLAAMVIWTVTTSPNVVHLRGAGTTAQPQAQADLFIDRHDHTAQLQVHGLSRPTSSTEVYEVWLIRGGKPQAVAYLQAQPDGSYSTTLGEDISGYSVLATTLEPRPGNAAPQGTEAFSISLTSA